MKNVLSWLMSAWIILCLVGIVLGLLGGHVFENEEIDRKLFFLPAGVTMFLLFALSVLFPHDM